jgi:GTP cyclohydrolase II
MIPMADKATLYTPGARSGPNSLVAVDRAVADLRRGGFVIVTGGETGLVVQAAEAVTPQSLDRLGALGSAELRLLLTRHRATALGISADGEGPVALALGEGSAAQEVRDIADPAADVSFRLPPTANPAASEATVFTAAVELTKLARLLPAALAAPLAGGTKRAEALAQEANLLTVSADAVSVYEFDVARTLKPVSQARVPLVGAEVTRVIAYRPSDGGVEHLAIIIGDPDGEVPVLTRLHSECFTGDLLASLRCDCGDQLRGAIEEIAAVGAGVLIYLAQEGRGIGLVNKLRAYNLQDEGLDTLDANEQLGFDADERIYLPAAEILRDLGFGRVRLLTNNPEKVSALTRCGIEVVERVPHVFPANAHNEYYLRTKKTRSGHII